jgi:hypothetical protein
MKKRTKKYSIGTAFTRATKKALKNSRMRLKTRFRALIKKTKKKMTGMTKKVDRAVAKRIRSITRRRY